MTFYDLCEQVIRKFQISTFLISQQIVLIFSSNFFVVFLILLESFFFVFKSFLFLKFTSKTKFANERWEKIRARSFDQSVRATSFHAVEHEKSKYLLQISREQSKFPTLNCASACDQCRIDWFSDYRRRFQVNKTRFWGKPPSLLPHQFRFASLPFQELLRRFEKLRMFILVYLFSAVPTK